MRSFSNIMTNFAGNLHLLVDSIGSFFLRSKGEKRSEKVARLAEKHYLCGRKAYYSLFRSARRDACRSKNLAFYSFKFYSFP